MDHDGRAVVVEHGNVANWSLADARRGGIGGAMDLAIGAKNVYVMMNLFTKDGTAKLVPA